MKDKASILIVDDDESICKTLSLIFSKKGYGAETAGSGREAIEKVQGKPFNLALLDIKLPDMEGVELLRPLKKMHPDMAVLMVTAYASVESTIQDLKDGTSAYITKPLNMDEVLSTVSGALEKQRLLGEQRHAEELLQERVKELTCLYAINHDMRKQLSLEGVCRGIVKHLVPAMRFPEITIPVIELDNRRFTSKKYTKGLSHGLHAEIRVGGEACGHLWIYYSEDKPFLIPEEQNLTTAIAEDFSMWLEWKQAKEEHRKLEAQLIQAQRMEAIASLASGIAHDFNNTLMAIQGNVSFLLSSTDSSHPHFEKLRNIEQFARNGGHLTKQLLEFARGGEHEGRPTNLNELVKKSSHMFSRTRKEIIIYTRYQEGIWAVEADPIQIEQTLLNLYVNAWQAMPGGGELYFETRNVILDEDFVKPYNVEAGRYVRISFTDTGIGMDKATRKRIFEPFFTTKQKEGGTGLGLASVYGIIRNHGGLIDVYSEKGKGTTFNIYLPALEKEVAEEKGVPEEVSNGSETVLLVDDEDMIIDLEEEVLETMGYRVLSARSGKKAIQVYEKNKGKIDIVIVDMSMPEMGGGETYDRLKQIDPDVKVILSSGFGMNRQAVEILERGCNGFIEKPFTMAQLSQKLREILANNTA